jgi:hypothetical protein
MVHFAGGLILQGTSTRDSIIVKFNPTAIKFTASIKVSLKMGHAMLTGNPTTASRIPVRTLPVLVPIIADGLKQVRQNVTEIGKAMAEARQQMSYTALLAWSEKNFRLKKTQTKYYLSVGKAGGTGPTVSGKKIKRNQKNKKTTQSAHTGNGSVHTTPEHEMGVALIEAGFRALAKTMHPDKGGSQSAMTMLNKVRGRLKTLWSY